ncbi:MAG: ParB/RepB/Spo0J family partition protein, partial [Nanoarchaeota archaeon]|nr:ParB/RepB/Spo0J family partition protein [Nanoarchaeota archaeon]
MTEKRNAKRGIQQPLAATVAMEDIFLYPNYRQSFNQFRLAALARSIRERGLIKPVIVNMEDDGQHGIVAGQRRYLAHRIISAPTIKCMIYQGLTPDQIIKIQLAENSQEKIAPDELAESYWQMYLGALSKSTGMPMSDLDALADYWSMPPELRKKYSMTRFCRDIGKSRSQIRRAFLYQRLHQHYKDILAEGKIKYTSAVEVARIQNKNDQMAFTDIVRRNSVVVAVRVDQYLRDKEGFELMAQANGNNGNGQDLQTAREIDRLTGFFGSYVAMCGEVSWLYKDFSNDSGVQQSLERIINMSQKLDERLSDVPYYHEMVKAPRKKSLRELILGNELHTVLKQYGEGETRPRQRKKKVFEVKRVPITRIVEDEKQPRRRYGQRSLENLAESVKALGVLQPILVRPVGKGKRMKYMIVTGHRRTRASRRADMKDMPAIIAYGLSDADARILQHEEDIFEEVALGERAAGIYNMKRLKEQDLGKALSVTEFAGMMPGFGIEEVGRALRFHALEERIKILEMKGL